MVQILRKSLPECLSSTDPPQTWVQILSFYYHISSHSHSRSSGKEKRSLGRRWDFLQNAASPFIHCINVFEQHIKPYVNYRFFSAITPEYGASTSFSTNPPKILLSWRLSIEVLSARYVFRYHPLYKPSIHTRILRQLFNENSRRMTDICQINLKDHLLQNIIFFISLPCTHGFFDGCLSEINGGSLISGFLRSVWLVWKISVVLRNPHVICSKICQRIRSSMPG